MTATNRPTRIPPIITAFDKTCPAVVLDEMPKNSKNAEKIIPTNKNALIVYSIVFPLQNPSFYLIPKIPAERPGTVILKIPSAGLT